MFKKINFQFVISYLGLSPFIIILFDKFVSFQLDPNIMKEFSVFYSLIIFVFIGALNWNLKKNISHYLILLGVFPSFISVFIIIIFLYSYEVFSYLIILFILQLTLDNFNYKEEKESY